MTTTLRRRPCWAFAAALAASAGCGEPPPMVTMSPPGVGGDPLAVKLDGEEFKAKAIGEAVSTNVPADDVETTREAVPVLEPTAPGEEVQVDSGLTYSTLKQGDPDAAMAKVGDMISVLYEGKLDDGSVFDTNMGKEPIEFTLAPGSLIKGWVEGIPGMKVGERRKLIVPAKLGYGAGGMPPDIPPNATLTFEVELVALRKGG